MLAVIEHEQHRPITEGLDDAGDEACPGALLDAEGGRDRVGHHRTLGNAAEIDEPHAAGVGRGLARSDLYREARLADTARSGKGEHRRLAQAFLGLGDLRGAPDEARQLAREVVGGRVQRSDRREVGPQPWRHDLEDALGSVESLEPMRPEILERDPRGHGCGAQDADRIRHEDLAPVAGGADPGRAVHVDADVARSRRLRLATVQPHPNANLGVLRPSLIVQVALSRHRRREAAAGGLE